MAEHKSLEAALLAFQANPPHIELDSKNPHFKSKFASLAGITKALQPRLSDEGLAYSQPLSNLDGQPAICTILFHAASGDRLESITPLLLGGKTDPQSHGSAVTYARRYALLSILGLVGDEDDDGNAASAQDRRPPTPTKASGTPPRPDAGADDIPFGEDAPPPEAAPFDPPGDLLTDKQNKMLGRLVTKLTASGQTDVESVRAWMDAHFGKTSRASLTKSEASEVIEWLLELEKAAA